MVKVKKKNVWINIVISMFLFASSLMNVYLTYTDNANIHFQLVLIVASILYFCLGVRTLWKTFRK